MIEVFKTNVVHPDHARLLIKQIHDNFPEYNANFDLDDCDRILRIKTSGIQIEADAVIQLVGEFGCAAEILPDIISLVEETGSPDNSKKSCFSMLRIWGQ